MFAINLRKMGKDRRQVTEKLTKNFELLTNAENQIDLLKGFLTRMAHLVNLLRKAESIDICLYAQDDKDRQQTVLYGINEEAGLCEIKSETPIQVNNNCLQCSGNASFIKKAFKLACLTYNSSKVTYQNQQFMREELLHIREEMILESEMLNIEKLLKKYNF